MTALTDTVKSEVTEKVNEAARQQADRIIKEAEDNAKVIREKAASSAETIRSEADLRAKSSSRCGGQWSVAVAAAKKAAEALNRKLIKEPHRSLRKPTRELTRYLQQPGPKPMKFSGNL